MKTTSSLLATAILGLNTFLFSHAAEESNWKPGLDLTIEGASNLSGGAKTGSTAYGIALGHLDWQKPESADHSGVNLHFYASVLNISGNGPSGEVIGNYITATSIEGYESTRLYSWWLEATQDAWSVRVGALLADDEFTSTEAGGNLVNSAFGWPLFASSNTRNTGPAFFAAALGARVEYKVSDATLLRVGIYDGDSFDSRDGDPSVNAHGWHYRPGHDHGWFTIAEAALTPSDSTHSLKLGLWYHSAKFDDQRYDGLGNPLAVTGNDPRQLSGNYGVYGAIEKTLSAKAGEAGYTTGYLRVGFSPSDRNTVAWAIDSGIAFTGLFPGRAEDVTTIGIVHGAISSAFAENAFASDPFSPKPDYERVLEVAHAIALTPRLTLVPDVQYIQHPGASAAMRDAVAVILRLQASF